MYVRPSAPQRLRLAEMRAAQLRRLAVLFRQYARRAQAPIRRDEPSLARVGLR
ncbi:MAG: hypothetical protein ABTR54_09280 [Candidatus Competibacter sp.]